MELYQRIEQERYGCWNRMCQSLGVPSDAWLCAHKVRNVTEDPRKGEVCFLRRDGSEGWWCVSFFNKKLDTIFLTKPLEDFL